MIYIFLIIFLLILDLQLGSLFSIRQKPIHFTERQSHVHFFDDGHIFFDDYFQKISAAKQHIHILFFIVKNDSLSQTFYDLLKKKSTEGVEVRLLVDWAGSFSLKRKTIRELRKSGVKFSFANKPSFPYFFYKVNCRNHRKITVIDGNVSYIGGFNVGNEYISKDTKFDYWRDYHLRIEGEGSHDLQECFLLDWLEATKENIMFDRTYFPYCEKDVTLHKFRATDGRPLEKEYLQIISQAKTRIVIGTPYFIPGKKIIEALIKAKERGVHIQILIPKKADHALVKQAAIPYFIKLLQNNCEIYEYQSGFYHAKIIMIDDSFCDIGTANFDKRSFQLNKEVNCYLYDQEIIQKIKQTLHTDLGNSSQLTLEQLKKRPLMEKGKEVVATIFSSFL